MDVHAGEMAELERISVDAARQSPGLIVWPEVPAPFSLADPKFARIARSHCCGLGQAISWWASWTGNCRPGAVGSHQQRDAARSRRPATLYV